MAPDSRSLVVVVPTRGRAHALKSLALEFKATTPAHRMLFVVDPDDPQSFRLGREVGDVLVTVSRLSYAAKANRAIERSTEPFLLFAADDVKPHPGWFEAAHALMSEEVGFVSTNDLGSERVMDGEYATCPLVARSYAEQGTIDGGPGVFHEGYHHNPADIEASETAKHRGAFAYCPESVVEHMHPNYGKAEVDQTYLEGGMNEEANEADAVLFAERSALWTSP